MRKLTGMIAVAAISAAMMSVASAQADRTKVGTLECDVSGGIGMIIASKKSVQCVFTPSQADLPREIYVGDIEKFGLDIGATSGGKMLWSVVAPTSRARGALAGHYAGASAEATVGAGAGANALVGGSNRTVTLQPVSVQAQAGLNLADGVAGLNLAPVR
jgi:hypothetical protein